jgi:hypothetical protein
MNRNPFARDSMTPRSPVRGMEGKAQAEDTINKPGGHKHGRLELDSTHSEDSILEGEDLDEIAQLTSEEKIHKSLVLMVKLSKSFEVMKVTNHERFQAVEYKQRQHDFELEAIRREINKKKIRIEGVKEDAGEKFRDTEQKVVKLLKEDLQIESHISLEQVRRIGRPVAGRNRPILVTLERLADKFQIFGHKKNMKNRETCKQIYIKGELTQYEAYTQKQLRAKVREWKNLNLGIKATIKGSMMFAEKEGEVKKFIVNNEGQVEELGSGKTHNA